MHSSCAVQVYDKVGDYPCTLGKSYGCVGSAGSVTMWVSDGCRGFFVCDGIKIGMCGMKERPASNCSCASYCMRAPWAAKHLPMLRARARSMRAAMSTRPQQRNGLLAGPADGSLLVFQFWQGSAEVALHPRRSSLIRHNSAWCQAHPPCVHRLIIADAFNSTQPPMWAKLAAAIELLPQASLLMYLDFDACIVRSPVPLIHAEANMLVSSDAGVKGWQSTFNSGVFLVRRSERGRWLLAACLDWVHVRVRVHVQV